MALFKLRLDIKEPKRAGTDLWIKTFGKNQERYEIQALMPNEIRLLVSKAIVDAIAKYDLAKREQPIDEAEDSEGEEFVEQE